MPKGLLVVTRKEDECIRITTPQGETIDILIVQVRGSYVRVGVKSDKTFRISRTQDLNGTEDIRKLKTADDWIVSKSPKVEVGEKFEAVFRYYEPSKGIPDSDPVIAVLEEDAVFFYENELRHTVNFNWYIHKWRKIQPVQEAAHVTQ